MTETDKVTLLIEIIGLSKMPDAIIESELDSIRKVAANDEKANNALAVVEGALKSRRKDLLVKFTEVYSKHLTQSQVEQLINFHTSPIGRHIAEVGPKIQEDVSEVSRDWFIQGMKSVETDLQAILNPNKTDV